MNSSSNVNLYANILRRHGRATIVRVKRLKRQGIKVAKLESKYEFLIDCKRNNLVPKTLRIRAPKDAHPTDADRLSRSLSKICLNYAISRCRKERHWARSSFHRTLPCVKSVLTLDEFSAVDLALERKTAAVSKKSSAHKERKLAMMLKSIVDLDPHPDDCNLNDADRVVNLTDYNLTVTQRALLARNMKFGMAPTNVPTVEIINAVESVCTFLPVAESTQWKMKIANLLNKKFKVKVNYTPEELAELNKLKNEKNLIFLTADKGGMTVIMEKTVYAEKMLEIVQSDAYEKVQGNNFPATVSIGLRKWCAEVIKLAISTSKSKSEIANVKKELAKELNKFKPSADEEYKIPHMYGNPKTHKTRIPLRPIVSTIDSVLRNTELFLKPLLALAINNSKYNIKNATSALDALKELKVDENTRLCSFDIKNMFNSIPREELLVISRKRLEKQKKVLKTKTHLSPKQIVDLVAFTLKNTFFELNDEIYIQKTGLAMGSSISPILADIYMEHFLEKTFKGTMFKMLLFLKYVDDCICVFNCKKVDEEKLLDHLNTQNTHIQFTIEKEENSSLPFLDLHIHRNTNKLTFTVYRKPTDKGILLNFKSNHSFTTKATVVRAGLHRAYVYCENAAERKAEIERVYQILYKNNYPHHFIAKVHEKVKNCHARKLANLRAANANSANTVNAAPARVVTAAGTNEENAALKVGFKSTLKIPYVPGISEAIHKITKKCLDEKVRVVYSCKNTLRKMLMHVKPKKKPILKNCIYQIECECKAKYIGQTKRPLKIRVKEHQKALGEIQCEWNKNHNKLALHAQKMNHAVDFQNTTVIHFENKWNQRLVAESMAMIAKDNVISQSSRTIDKIFWKNIKDNEKNTRGMNYFCEKSRLNDVITHNVSQSTPVPPTPATPPIRPLPHSYNLRTRAAALA